MSYCDMIVPGISFLGAAIPALLAEVKIEGYACRAVWDWEAQRKGKGENQTISEFRARWTVPPPPKVTSRQTIFLFNGMLISSRQPKYKSILQPVLQWGNDDAGGGPFWAIATWYVRTAQVPGSDKYSIDYVSRTKFIEVKPGEILTGVMRQFRETDSALFTCSGEFEGVGGTSLVVRIGDELVRNCIALEGYKIDNYDMLPPILETCFTEINTNIGERKADVQWTVQNLVSSETRAEVIHHGEGDEVIIHYR